MKHGIAALKESLASGAVVDRPDLAVSFEELNDLLGFQEAKRLEVAEREAKRTRGSRTDARAQSEAGARLKN